MCTKTEAKKAPDEPKYHVIIHTMYLYTSIIYQVYVDAAHGNIISIFSNGHYFTGVESGRNPVSKHQI